MTHEQPPGARELMPCPFCGSSNDLDMQYGTNDREGKPMNVYCGACGACGPWSYYETVAIKDWNRRAPTRTEGKGET